MSQEEAKVRASRAAKQARHASRNGAAAAAEAAPDAETVRSAAKSVTAMTTELGLGFLSLALAVTAGTYSISRFKTAWDLKP